MNKFLLCKYFFNILFVYAVYGMQGSEKAVIILLTKSDLEEGFKWGIFLKCWWNSNCRNILEFKINLGRFLVENIDEK